jgi:hypothetical protein
MRISGACTETCEAFPRRTVSFRLTFDSFLQRILESPLG